MKKIKFYHIAIIMFIILFTNFIITTIIAFFKLFSLTSM